MPIVMLTLSLLAPKEMLLATEEGGRAIYLQKDYYSQKRWSFIKVESKKFFSFVAQNEMNKEKTQLKSIKAHDYLQQLEEKIWPKEILPKALK